MHVMCLVIPIFAGMLWLMVSGIVCHPLSSPPCHLLGHVYPIHVFLLDGMQVCAGTIGLPKGTEEKNEWG
jgi:hypothetical protein